MSRDIRQYWQEVRALEQSLPEFLWVVSVKDPEARAVAQVPAAVGARLLRKGTHRRATDDEVAAHHAREKEMKQAARVERLRKQGTSLVVVND